jgi:hypothetical protein
MTQCSVAVHNVAKGCRYSEVATDDAMFIRRQQVAQCCLKTSGIHKTRVASFNLRVKLDQLESAVVLHA